MATDAQGNLINTPQQVDFQFLPQFQQGDSQIWTVDDLRVIQQLKDQLNATVLNYARQAYNNAIASGRNEAEAQQNFQVVYQQSVQQSNQMLLQQMQGLYQQRVQAINLQQHQRAAEALRLIESSATALQQKQQINSSSSNSIEGEQKSNNNEYESEESKLNVWRNSMVGKTIEVEYSKQWYSAHVSALNKNGLFTVTYDDDGSAEKMKLYENFTAEDPDADERFSWRIRIVPAKKRHSTNKSPIDFKQDNEIVVEDDVKKLENMKKQFQKSQEEFKLEKERQKQEIDEERKKLKIEKTSFEKEKKLLETSLDKSKLEVEKERKSIQKEREFIENEKERLELLEKDLEKEKIEYAKLVSLFESQKEEFKNSKDQFQKQKDQYQKQLQKEKDLLQKEKLNFQKLQEEMKQEEEEEEDQDNEDDESNNSVEEDNQAQTTKKRRKTSSELRWSTRKLIPINRLPVGVKGNWTSGKSPRALGYIPSGKYGFIPPTGKEALNWRVRVWWKDDRKFYEGTIETIRAKKHKVIYDDGDVEWLVLEDEKIEWFVPEGIEFALYGIDPERAYGGH